MYRPEDILARLREKPFRPFRFLTSDERQRYEIRQAELVMVCESYIMIGDESPGQPGIYSRMNRLAIVHILGMEDILPPVSTTNGTAG